MMADARNSDAVALPGFRLVTDSPSGKNTLDGHRQTLSHCGHCACL